MEPNVLCFVVIVVVLAMKMVKGCQEDISQENTVAPQHTMQKRGNVVNTGRVHDQEIYSIDRPIFDLLHYSTGVKGKASVPEDALHFKVEDVTIEKMPNYKGNDYIQVDAMVDDSAVNGNDLVTLDIYEKSSTVSPSVIFTPPLSPPVLPTPTTSPSVLPTPTISPTKASKS